VFLRNPHFRDRSTPVNRGNSPLASPRDFP
jgi:hypothetical protein